MNDYIVYVKTLNNKRLVVGKMKVSGFNELNRISENGGSFKLIYFEYRKNIRSAEMKEKKLKSLPRTKLIDEIKKSNPELLDLKHTIPPPNQAGRNFEELIY